ncbi:YaaA family protein [Caminibacter mediatlanticus TB-2]|uniref:YaaA family protein n=1 Tax=Caminibacter mediatlanticus TB-2 TaxID=391592 RepID=A0ABX5VBS0_9BACT|nr:YaaA family protein [Caminibacter mediatlanticus]QCT94912.1 YaaA family protein [Caminibacter mediatlanticus TB-2]
MKILFSPSEAKKKGGESEFEFNFLFPHLNKKRKEVVDKYNDFIKTALKEELEKLFGVKEVEEFLGDIYSKKTFPAIKRYSGVAYDYLDFDSLGENAKNYIYKNVIIFSNLFGPISAGDFIPEYKLKQGEKIGDFEPWKFYKKHFSKALDEYLENEDILDLRAGFYSKFYSPKKEVFTFKFLKNKKVVSHFAKAYRGIILREVAKRKVDTIDELLKLEIENLQIKEIIESKKKKEIICEIKE